MHPVSCITGVNIRGNTGSYLLYVLIFIDIFNHSSRDRQNCSRLNDVQNYVNNSTAQEQIHKANKCLKRVVKSINLNDVIDKIHRFAFFHTQYTKKDYFHSTR